MVQLAEQIAVLDGLGAIRPGYADGRTGANRAAVDQYGRVVMRGVLNRRNVIDAGEGANYSGGSSYAAGMPLMPSTIGLADMPGTLPTRMHVIDPSGGANYSGGSSYAPGIPLVSSNSGLAATVGASGGSAADQDLAGAFNSLGAIRPGSADGRTGANRAAVDQYGRPIMRGVLSRKNVIDASEGANYAGGSSYAAGLPLMPSSVGLAGLDAVGDLAWGGWLKNANLRSKMGQQTLNRSRWNVMQLVTRLRQSHPTQKPVIVKALKQAVAKLREVRTLRAKQVTRSIRGGVPVTSSRPYSPSGMGAVTMMRGGVPVTMQTPYSPALEMWK